ncbi:MAG TPA: hypothetical protein VIP09_14795 [Dehalococcoidia bacterium]
MQAVLEVAWDDNVESFEESRLIKRLEEKMGVCRRDHLVLEALVTKRAPVSGQEVEETIRALTYEGLVCQFKHQGSSQLVVPDEIAAHLRTAFTIVLQSAAYRNLAMKLPTATIRSVLEKTGQPSVALKKEFLIDRLIDGDISPTVLLENADDPALDGLFFAFPELKKPTMRAVKVRHLIAHFDRVTTKSTDAAPEDPDKVYYDYLVELASRDYDVLRAANVIHRDQNVDRFFERAVRFAFRELLGHPSAEFTGSAHADGGSIARNGRMALWDCKSCIGSYALTESKCRQFLDYVHRERPAVVDPFLVISAGFSSESAGRALTLKAMCPPGTEVGLLSADDLKWLSEKWSKEHPGKRLPLDVLGSSGLLSRDVLEFRLKTFAHLAEDATTS